MGALQEEEEEQEEEDGEEGEAELDEEGLVIRDRVRGAGAGAASAAFSTGQKSRAVLGGDRGSGGSGGAGSSAGVVRVGSRAASMRMGSRRVGSVSGATAGEVSRVVARILKTLRTNLVSKSRDYKSNALGALFLMNNVHYMVSHVGESGVEGGGEWGGEGGRAHAPRAVFLMSNVASVMGKGEDGRRRRGGKGRGRCVML